MSTDLKWFKSSYSAPNGGDCVEVALSWTKSTYSGEGGGNCVEVATCPHTIHVRDSKDLTVPALALSPAAWSRFLTYAAS
ncbi:MULTISPECIES: DUF397 domain-containing protein [unclassified Streptomyces]|uniref:DUF397 domain-containing protein n=1 Tax=unclassified Streptomyces TaxID=2593676 RepID=UPI002255B04E|nr:MULTISPECIES: DUF397 domain-containing protein [unclassified Streptomyces]MCX5142008.1 DUF397 domain-containing protein [Streptomyces sp. NBC_00338]WRZ66477.1 DUF397 domain-containing protein [Streptomyces sp. NBC_01257]WSU60467.1 DUF397 domain-containing protein [Streptomyces sp. NBC_01104]